MSCRIHSTTSFNIHCLGPISLLGYTIVEQQHLPSNLFIILGYRSRDRLITSQKDGTHSAACHCNFLAQWPSAFSGRLSSQLESFHLFSACRFTFVLDEDLCYIWRFTGFDTSRKMSDSTNICNACATHQTDTSNKQTPHAPSLLSSKSAKFLIKA